MHKNDDWKDQVKALIALELVEKVSNTDSVSTSDEAGDAGNLVDLK